MLEALEDSALMFIMKPKMHAARKDITTRKSDHGAVQIIIRGVVVCAQVEEFVVGEPGKGRGVRPRALLQHRNLLRSDTTPPRDQSAHFEFEDRTRARGFRI